MANALRREILAGNRKVIDELYSELWDELIYYFFNKSVQEADAEDIFGTVFLEFLKKIQLNKIPPEAKPKAYIMGMVKIEVRNFFSKKKRGLEILNDYKLHPKLSESADSYDEEKLFLVGKKIEEIDDTCKEIFRLYYFEKLELKEILERIENIKTIGSLKVTKSRCLKKLRALVKKAESEEGSDRSY